MLRRILIGLDGSAYSSAAVELGIRWARRFDALLVGLDIVDEPAIRRRQPVPIGAGCYKTERDQWLLAEARRHVEKFLKQFARQCALEGVKCTVLEDVGSPWTRIVHGSRLCDLTLLGQRTYFRFPTQDWPGQTLRKVLRRTSRPVVAVPEAATQGGCVIVAYNGSPQADRALQAFQALALGAEEEVHVVSIHADPAAAALLAEQAVDFLKLHGHRAVAHPLGPTASAAKMILDQARQLQAGLLVMGAYGRSMWHEAVLGSITTSVLRASPAPLFLSR